MTTSNGPQPIGPLVDPHPAKRPERITLKGRWITLVPLDAEAHAKDLFEGSNGDAERERVWTYLFNGPFDTLAEFAADVELKAKAVDPHYFAILDNASGRAVGLCEPHAHRSSQSRHRGRRHHVHARDAAHAGRD